MFCLFKVVERYGPDYHEYPEIRIILAQGNEDITIKISDEGGGIARSGIPLIWTYMYTTAENPALHDGKGDFNAPMAGYLFSYFIDTDMDYR